ncbi:MAG: ribosome maturation factor RimM [Gammaproteobacteria bacterium]
MMEGETGKLLLGRISGIYGVKGWVKVFSYTRPAENILNYPSWYLKHRDEETLYKVREGRPQGKGLVASLEGIEDRDIARLLVGADIYIERDQLPSLPEGEFYWTDLLGLQVINRQGQSLGEVVEILETGANDVLVVKGESRELIPWVWGTYLLDVDMEAGRITVDWQGLGD